MPFPDIAVVRMVVRMAGGTARACSDSNERRENALGVLSRLTALHSYWEWLLQAAAAEIGATLRSGDVCEGLFKRKVQKIVSSG